MLSSYRKQNVLQLCLYCLSQAVRFFNFWKSLPLNSLLYLHIIFLNLFFPVTTISFLQRKLLSLNELDLLYETVPYFMGRLSGPAVPRIWNPNYFFRVVFSFFNIFEYYNFIACVVIVSALSL